MTQEAASDTEYIIYQQVFSITNRLKKLEQKAACVIFGASFIFLCIFFLFGKLNILLLSSVILFGIATLILARRILNIKLGGLLTFPLLLYYTLNTPWILLHFFLVTALGMPLGVMLIRRGYIGEMLFYLLSPLVLPITVVSYYLFTTYFPAYHITPMTHNPGDVIYLALPQLYIYNLLGQAESKVPRELISMVLLVAGGVGVWYAIITLA